MYKLRNKIVLSVPLVLSVMILGSVPAFAKDSVDATSGQSGSTASTTTTPTTDSNSKSSSTSGRSEIKTSMTAPAGTDDTAGVHTGTDDSAVKIKATETDNKTKADKLLVDLRKDHKEQTTTERNAACTAHKTGVTQRVTSISTNSQRFQTKIDSILAKAQVYKTSHTLTVADYDSLLALALAAQTTSAQSITALQAVAPTIDCTKTDNAQNLATFKVATQTARDNLNAYKTAVKNLLKALETAKDSSTTAQGSTN